MSKDARVVIILFGMALVGARWMLTAVPAEPRAAEVDRLDGLQAIMNARAVADPSSAIQSIEEMSLDHAVLVVVERAARHDVTRRERWVRTRHGGWRVVVRHRQGLPVPHIAAGQPVGDHAAAGRSFGSARLDPPTFLRQQAFVQRKLAP